MDESQFGSQTGREGLLAEIDGRLQLAYRLQRVSESPGHLLAASVVLTTASNLHDTRLLRILAVFAAILTAFFARTIARRMRALVFILVLSHVITP